MPPKQLFTPKALADTDIVEQQQKLPVASTTEDEKNIQSFANDLMQVLENGKDLILKNFAKKEHVESMATTAQSVVFLLKILP